MQKIKQIYLKGNIKCCNVTVTHFPKGPVIPTFSNVKMVLNFLLQCVVYVNTCSTHSHTHSHEHSCTWYIQTSDTNLHVCFCIYEKEIISWYNIDIKQTAYWIFLYIFLIPSISWLYKKKSSEKARKARHGWGPPEPARQLSRLHQGARADRLPFYPSSPPTWSRASSNAQDSTACPARPWSMQRERRNDTVCLFQGTHNSASGRLKDASQRMTHDSARGEAEADSERPLRYHSQDSEQGACGTGDPIILVTAVTKSKTHLNGNAVLVWVHGPSSATTQTVHLQCMPFTGCIRLQ